MPLIYLCGLIAFAMLADWLGIDVDTALGAVALTEVAISYATG